MFDPIVPFAPTRFSTTMVWPSAPPVLAAMSRATRSSAGPGGNGTTIVIGFPAGQVWAIAIPLPSSPNVARRYAVKRRRRSIGSSSPASSTGAAARGLAEEFDDALRRDRRLGDVDAERLERIFDRRDER